MRAKFAAQFDLPMYERRDIYGDPAKDHMLVITNSGTLWFGNQKGVGQSMRAPPQEVYRGPFLVGIMQSIIELKENTSSLQLVENPSDSTSQVVEVYVDGALSSRVFFNKTSHLPVRIEKLSFGLQSDNVAESTETITLLADYKQFGSAMLPTRVSIQQGGIETLNVTLDSADFDSPIDRSVFALPE